jgi:cytochrome c oxidase assembly factor CtaG
VTQPVAHEPSGGLGWNLDPALMAGAALVAGAYAVRAHRLERLGRGVPIWRQACFYTGVAVLLTALVSPIDSIGESRLFYVHMAQHLMIGDLAPLLILLGLSGPMLRPVLAAPLVMRLRPLGNPLVALPLWVAALYAWHVPALYEAALENSAVHDLEHTCFFAAGLLMWAAVIEPLPGPLWFGNGLKAAYVLVVRTFSAVLATVFLWAGTPIYAGYRAGEQAWGISPLTDQQIGGGIMFIEGATVTLLVFAWLFLRWVSEAELRQSLLDAGADARVATRAARYGRRSPARRGPARFP